MTLYSRIVQRSLIGNLGNVSVTNTSYGSHSTNGYIVLITYVDKKKKKKNKNVELVARVYQFN